MAKTKKKKTVKLSKQERLILDQLEELANEDLSRDFFNEFERLLSKDEPRRVQKKNKKPKRARTKKIIKVVTERVQKRVKTFPTKINKERFFISNKKVFNVTPPIDILTPEDFLLVEQAIKIITPKIIQFFKRYKRPTKKQRLNVGYIIYLAFESKDGKNVTDFNTVSFLPSRVVKNKDTIKLSLQKLLQKIRERFVADPKQAYIFKSGFKHLILFGFEAEIETL